MCPTVALALALATSPAADPLPPGAVARLGSARLRHGGDVVGIAFAPDGKTAASVGGDAVRLWDAADGRELRTWRDPRGRYVAAAFAPDGASLVAATMFGLRRLDVATGRQAPLDDPPSLVHRLALSPDGRTLAVAGTLGELAVIDRVAGTGVRELKGHGGEVHALAFTPDGRLLAGGEDKTLRVWDVATDGPGRKVRQFAAAVRGVAVAPDGRQAAVTIGHWDGLLAGPRVALVDLQTGDEVRLLADAGRGVCCAAYSRDATLLAVGGRDGVIALWDLAGGRLVRRLTGHADAVRGLAFAPDGKTLASASEDSTVRLWDVATGTERLPGTGHRAPVNAVAVTADGRAVATAGRDGSVRVWDAATGAEARPPVRPEPGRLQAVAFADGGRSVAAAGLQVHLIDLATGRVRQPFGTAVLLTQAAALSDGGRLLAACQPGFFTSGVAVCDLTGGPDARRLPGPPQSPTALAVSADGRVVAAGGYATGAGVDDPAPIHVWGPAGGKPRVWTAHRFQVRALALAPDGKLLATGGGREPVALWDPATGRRVGELTGHAGGVAALAFSPDGRCLAVGDEAGGVRVWEVLSRGERRAFRGHEGEVRAAAFSADGRRLVTGGADTTAVVWDLTGGPHLAVTPADADRLWADLGGEPGPAAAAVWRLAAGCGPAVALIADRLPPLAAVDDARLAGWVADLDSPRFATRAAAAAALAGLGDRAEPALRRALAGKLSAEQRRQVQDLLDRLGGVPPSAELRAERAVEALERADTADARRALERLAGGADGRLTRAAKAALDRLNAVR